MRIITMLPLVLTLGMAGSRSVPKPRPEITLPPVEITPAAFTARSSLPWLAEVARVASCVVALPKFIAEVGAVAKYTHTTKTPAEVARAFKGLTGMRIRTYQTKNPFSAAIATTYKSAPGELYFNTRKNPRAMKAMVNTACHEASHALGFGHGDNSPRGKELSVPYKVGVICENHVEECL